MTTAKQLRFLKRDPVAWKSVEQIIALRTLPHQIDYTAPYHMKANLAEQYLNSLDLSLKTIAYNYIDEQVNDYYESGAAEADSKF